MNLFELGKKYNSVKCYDRFKYSWQFCSDIYPIYFENLRLTTKTLLEIGVGKGGSLRMWEEYFPYATIYGVDVLPVYKSRRRIKFRHGSQRDSKFLKSISEEVGCWDIIIDDGSHIFEDQKISYETLWPYLKSGGFYAIEDVMTRHSRSMPCLDYFYNIINNQFTNSKYFSKEIQRVIFHPALIMIEKK